MVYISFNFLLVFLTRGQLITGNSKAWLGGFGELGHPYSYTHPTTKQCNYSYTHPSSKQCDAAAGNHTHSQYALATTVAALQNKITKLEGSVDMAKLVYSTSIESYNYDSTTVTYKASFVRVKIAAYVDNSNSGCCGTAYVDIALGGSGYIYNDGQLSNITYSTGGVVTIPKANSKAFTLEFYNY